MYKELQEKYPKYTLVPFCYVGPKHLGRYYVLDPKTMKYYKAPSWFKN